MSIEPTDKMSIEPTEKMSIEPTDDQDLLGVSCRVQDLKTGDKGTVRLDQLNNCYEYLLFS